jgi:hypothetical protein
MRGDRLNARGGPWTRPVPGIRELAADIVRTASDYVRERQHWSPRTNDAIRARAMGPKPQLGWILGLLLGPRRGGADTLHVFQTERHARYMKMFDPRSVLLTGWVGEWKLARREGYRFAWSFGVTAAVDLAMFREWTLPLRIVLAQWRRALGRPRCVTVYLSEDTLAFGSFLAHLVRGLPNHARSVCIAHGYYGSLDMPLRYEGALCDYNFVWDERQAALLSSTHSGLHVIGPPHDARAQPSPVETVVFVGVGHPSANESVFARSMASYLGIAEVAAQRHGLRVVYRPHPTERADPTVMDALRTRFGELDKLSLVDRLSGPRSVFVGFVSSLLHEASVAGHPVVYVAGQPGAHPVFDRDLDLEPDDPSAFDGWLTRLKALSTPEPADRPAAGPVALERFRRSLAAIDRGTAFAVPR